MKALFSILLVVVALSSSCAKRELSDEEIREKLVGTWLPDATTARTVSGEVTYKKDSTFDGFMLIRRPDLSLNLQFAGKWNIKEHTLKLEYTKSTVPKLLPVGNITADRILSITEKELTFVTEEGKTESRRRKPN